MQPPDRLLELWPLDRPFDEPRPLRSEHRQLDQSRGRDRQAIDLAGKCLGRVTLRWEGCSDQVTPARRPCSGRTTSRNGCARTQCHRSPGAIAQSVERPGQRADRHRQGRRRGRRLAAVKLDFQNPLASASTISRRTGWRWTSWFGFRPEISLSSYRGRGVRRQPGRGALEQSAVVSASGRVSGQYLVQSRPRTRRDMPGSSIHRSRANRRT